MSKTMKRKRKFDLKSAVPFMGFYHYLFALQSYDWRKIPDNFQYRDIDDTGCSCNRKGIELLCNGPWQS